ncbi:hypothetical protein E2C01_072017 [Portunus trituberculatus]|uniref:Uncharacterized protein n=1 Tax=Portunus trituberculatus TaxID=210409 RepID=A0A5B7HYL6_PORTR|nr:hypothetical protein [Portunus trituberculatus]
MVLVMEVVLVVVVVVVVVMLVVVTLSTLQLTQSRPHNSSRQTRREIISDA